jgi:hypothetical protein
LPPHAQAAAETLGYNQQSWDGSKKVAASSKSWKDLSADEKEAAKVLGYDRCRWDKVDYDSDEEDEASKSYSKSTVSSLLFSSPTDPGSYNPSMNSAKRFGSEVHSYYDDVSFDRLPTEAQKAAEFLGWTRSSWNANNAVPVEEKPWKDLTDDEKAACKALGWSQSIWDDYTGDGSVSVSTTGPSQTYGGCLFDDLPQVAKDAVTTLGYTASTWNNDGSVPVEEKDWGQLNGAEQQAAFVLGFSERTWNGPVGHLSTIASVSLEATDKDSGSSIHFIPGHKYYKTREWSQLPTEVQRAALTLGYSDIIWETGSRSPVDDMYWEEMSPRLRAAARKLGFHQDSWNRVVRLNLKMLKHRLVDV